MPQQLYSSYASGLGPGAFPGGWTDQEGAELGPLSWGSQSDLVPFTMKYRVEGGWREHYAHNISSYSAIHLLIHSLDISSLN